MIGFITIYFNIKFQNFLKHIEKLNVSSSMDGEFSQTLIINVLEHLE